MVRRDDHDDVCIYVFMQQSINDEQDATQGQFLAKFNWVEFRFLFQVDQLPCKS